MSAAWTPLAVRTGGTVAGLAWIPETNLVLAATSVGIFCSSDDGHTWALAGAGSTVPFAEGVAASACYTADHVLFAAAADGLYRSTGGDDGWRRILVGSRILALTTATSDGAAGVTLVGSESDGILRSDDGGHTWNGSNAGVRDRTVVALAVSPLFERDQLAFAGTPTGLYRSRSGAQAWRAIDTGLDVDAAIQCLAFSPAFPGDRVVLAGTESDGLLRSTDAGTTWTAVPSLAERSVTALAFARSGDTAAAATDAGVAISHDAGATWRLSGAELGPVLTVAVAPGRDVVLAGLPGEGIARSLDGGLTWSTANAGLTARLVLGLVASRDGTLFTFGPEDGLTMSSDAGRTWVPSNVGFEPCGVLGQVASHPSFQHAATTRGIYRRIDRAAAWQLVAEDSVAGVATHIAATPDGTRVVAASASGELLVSADCGQRWQPLSGPPGGGEILALGVSPDLALDRSVFVGRHRGGELVLWRSTTAGGWERWLVEHGSGGVALAFAPGAIFVGLEGRLLSPLRDVWDTCAGERRPAWRSIDVGDASARVTGLAVSLAYPTDRTVFISTNRGVFISRDAGRHVEPWSDGLLGAAIVAVAPSPEYCDDRLVYALGLGGSVWRRRDA